MVSDRPPSPFATCLKRRHRWFHSNVRYILHRPLNSKVRPTELFCGHPLREDPATDRPEVKLASLPGRFGPQVAAKSEAAEASCVLKLGAGVFSVSKAGNIPHESNRTDCKFLPGLPKQSTPTEPWPRRSLVTTSFRCTEATTTNEY